MPENYEQEYSTRQTYCNRSLYSVGCLLMLHYVFSSYSDVCEDEDMEDLEDLVGHFTRLRIAEKTRCVPERQNRVRTVHLLELYLLVERSVN